MSSSVGDQARPLGVWVGWVRLGHQEKCEQQCGGAATTAVASASAPPIPGGMNI